MKIIQKSQVKFLIKLLHPCQKNFINEKKKTNYKYEYEYKYESLLEY